jgi:hypothetical protein
MPGKIGGSDWPTVPRKIVWACADKSGEINDLPCDKPGIGKRTQAQRNVYVLTNEINNAIGHHEIECDLRIATKKLRQRWRKLLSNDWKRLHSQVSARGNTRRCDFGFRSLDGLKYLSHAAEVGLTLSGQSKVPRRSIDESNTKSKLQSRNKLCYRGRRQADVFSRG